MKVMMIDPPAGWKYGFPKPIPKLFDTFEEKSAWLVSEGYPQSEIDACGDHFYCRYFWAEELDNEDSD